MGLHLVLAFAAAAQLGGQPAAGPSHPAPFYTLPADGAWVEFEWKARAPGGAERAGLVRISSVGSVQVAGAPHRWVEVKKEWRRGSQPDFTLRKFLIAEKAFAEGRALDRGVAKAFAQNGPGAPVVPLTPERIKAFFTLGIDATLTPPAEAGEPAEVATRLGAYRARPVSARGKSGQRTLEYHGWLSNEVPFGCVKFTVREQLGGKPADLVFSATAVRQGQGAKSALDTGAK
jgi:hypothetical protein